MPNRFSLKKPAQVAGFFVSKRCAQKAVLMFLSSMKICYNFWVLCLITSREVDES